MGRILGVDNSPFTQEVLEYMVNETSNLGLEFPQGSANIKGAIVAIDSKKYSGVLITNPANIPKGRDFRGEVEDFGAYSGGLHIIRYSVKSALPVLVNVPSVDASRGRRFIAELENIGISEEIGNLNLGLYDTTEFIKQMVDVFKPSKS